MTQRGWCFSATRAGTRAAEASSVQWSQCFSTFFMLWARSHFCDVVRAVGASRGTGTAWPALHPHGSQANAAPQGQVTWANRSCAAGPAGNTHEVSLHGQDAFWQCLWPLCFLNPKEEGDWVLTFCIWLSWSLACLSWCDTGEKLLIFVLRKSHYFIAFCFYPSFILAMDIHLPWLLLYPFSIFMFSCERTPQKFP